MPTIFVYLHLPRFAYKNCLMCVTFLVKVQTFKNVYIVFTPKRFNFYISDMHFSGCTLKHEKMSNI